MVYVYKKNKQTSETNELIQKQNKNTSTLRIWTPKHRDRHE